MFPKRVALLIGVFAAVALTSSIQNASAVELLPSWDKTSYQLGNTAIITVVDSQYNLYNGAQETIYVTVTSDSFLQGKEVLLIETGINTGIFTGKVKFSSIPSEDSIFTDDNDFVHVNYRGFASSVKIEPRSILVSPITVSTDKNSYTFGEIITISGKAVSVTPGRTVIVSILDPIGTEIYSETHTISYEKRFDTKIRTEDIAWQNSGNYLIIVSSKYEPVVAETSFTYSTTLHSEEPRQSIKIFGTDNEIDYAITSGMISVLRSNEESKSLRFSLATNSGGHLTVVLPRYLIDSVTSSGDEQSFVVLADDRNTQYMEKITTNDRTLIIPYHPRTKSIEVLGTNLDMDAGLFNKSVNTSQIPSWVRNNAEWWSKGLIEEKDFLSGMEFLINQRIIHVSTSDMPQKSAAPFVPNWIKDTAGWWADGRISDQDFLNGIEYLVDHQIIKV